MLPFRKIFRILRIAMTALTVVVLAVALWAWWRWNTWPGYWHLTPTGGQQAADESERFEYWIVSQTSASRTGDGQWSAKVHTPQINQWLVERSKTWLANRKIAYPHWLNDPMVALQPGRIIVAAHVVIDGFDNILSLVYQPGTNEAGVVVMRLSEIRIGSLGIPADWVLDRVLRGYSQVEADKIRRAIQNITLSQKLGDGRTVSVRQMRIDPKADVVTLGCVTGRSTNHQ